MDLADHYVFVDWGPEFTHAHSIGLPELSNSGLTMGLGTLAAEYIVNRHAAAYMPARAIQRHIDAGRLHPVPDAPRFPYPVWAVWRNDIDPTIAIAAKASLTHIAEQVLVEQGAILARLAEVNTDQVVEELGQNGIIT